MSLTDINIMSLTDEDEEDGEGEDLSFSMYIDKKTVLGGKGSESRLSGVQSRRNHVWIRDDQVDRCYQCNEVFTFIKRKHHCRGCGKIFCYSCCNDWIRCETNKDNLIDPDEYIRLTLNPKPVRDNTWNLITINKTNNSLQRVCKKCNILYSKISTISKLILVFKLINIDIRDLINMSMVNKDWREASLCLLSEFREIQYTLPGEKLTPFQSNILYNSYSYITGHKSLLYNLFKVIQDINDKESKKERGKIKNMIDCDKMLIKRFDCWTLMCCRECRNEFGLTEIIHVLSYIKDPDVRKHSINLLEKLDYPLIQFIPIFIYALENEEGINEQHLLDFLIKKSLEDEEFRISLYYSLSSFSEGKNKYIYASLMANLVHRLVKSYGKSYMDMIKEGFSFCLSLEKLWMDDRMIPRIYNDVIYPLDPNLRVKSITHTDLDRKNSSTKPIILSLKVYPKNDQECLSSLGTSPDAEYAKMISNSLTKVSNVKVMYKREDLRKDMIILNTIRLMDSLIKEEGYDMNVILYNVLPFTREGGLIEIVEDCETLYSLKYKKGYSILNYIMENCEDQKVSVVRYRFIKSTAAYCVFTYLLGVGDRHLDNIMVKKTGELFHIDYGFIFNDPKPLAPKMRIIPEMVDALGGVNSKYYKRFSDYCDGIYSILRRHAGLFYTMLEPLVDITKGKGSHEITHERLRNEIFSRFLPSEYQTQAKVHLMKTINDSTNSSTLIDFIHYQSKEIFSTSRLYNLVRGIIS